MLHIHTLAQAKKTARALEKALQAAGAELPHGKALDLLAAMCGFRDWNGFAGTLTEEALTKQLEDFELSHMAHTGDETYGPEVALVAHTGFQLRYSRDDEVCEYVRVCDPLGRELMYWHSSEWQEDAELVMGAILGALVRGMPIEVKKKVQKKLAAKQRTRSKDNPRIQDVDFDKVHSAVFGGHCFNLEWREPEALKLLSDPQSTDFAEREDDTALHFHYEDDGLVYEETLSLGQLAALRWNAQQRCFEAPDGETFEFHYSLSFADHIGA
jgi:hypothetical protein